MAWAVTGVTVMSALLISACSDDAGGSAATSSTSSSTTPASTTSTTSSTAPPTTTTAVVSTTTTEPPSTTATALDGPYTSPDGLFSANFLSVPSASEVPELRAAMYVDRRPNNDQFSVSVRAAPTIPVDLVEVMNGQLAFIGPNAPETADLTVNGHPALLWSVGSSVSATHVYGLVVDLGDRVVQVTVIDDEGDNPADGPAFIDSFTLTG
jgi:hypothetical protein